jgi:hypothetical protein
MKLSYEPISPIEVTEILQTPDPTLTVKDPIKGVIPLPQEPKPFGDDVSMQKIKNGKVQTPADERNAEAQRQAKKLAWPYLTIKDILG